MTSRARSGRAAMTVSVTDALGRRLSAGAAAGLAAWLRRSAPSAARGHVSIAIVSDGLMCRLNRKYRGKNLPTDVLSFPAEPRRAGRRLTRHPRLLGDLAIARGVAARQARALGHALRLELRLLALHGLLHLLGYDHETDRGEMGRLENRLRRRAGLPSGLIARK